MIYFALKTLMKFNHFLIKTSLQRYKLKAYTIKTIKFSMIFLFIMNIYIIITIVMRINILFDIIIKTRVITSLSSLRNLKFKFNSL